MKEKKMKKNRKMSGFWTKSKKWGAGGLVVGAGLVALVPRIIAGVKAAKKVG